MADRISIRDLAKIAGVSRTTVSLALRDNHEISAETRERIQELARIHGYRSHPAVNALMQQVARGKRVHDEEIIALIRSGSDPDENAPGPLSIEAGAREEAFRMGYRLEVFWAGYKAANSLRLAHTLYHRGIRGVIWSPMPHPHPPIEFPWEHFVPISCTSSTDVPRLPVVSIHHAKGMALLLEELQERGFKRAGVMLLHYEDMRQDFGWSQGVDLFRHRGGQYEPSVLMLRKDPVKREVLAWVKAQKLDVVVTTPGLLEKASYLQGKLAMASLDVSDAERGRIGGLYQDMAGIGRHAIRSMSLRLANGVLGLPEQNFSVVTASSFVDGESLHPKK